MPPQQQTPSSSRKPFIIVGVIVLILIVIGIVISLSLHKEPVVPPVVTPAPVVTGPTHKVIGQSVQGRAIEAYTYGKGPTHLLFVGGVHGGYEWNSVLLSYTFMDYMDANPTVVPDSLSVTVIPTLNPDGVFAVTGKEGRFAVADVSTSTKVLESARFNANKVDLNQCA
ncbi:MAG: M14 family zinc carboxypeptidase [Patescibacteria group bacterium]